MREARRGLAEERRVPQLRGGLPLDPDGGESITSKAAFETPRPCSGTLLRRVAEVNSSNGISSSLANLFLVRLCRPRHRRPCKPVEDNDFWLVLRPCEGGYMNNSSESYALGRMARFPTCGHKWGK